MGLFSSKSDPVKDAAKVEKKVAAEQHRAYRAAGNNSKKHFRDENDATNMINAAVIDAEADVPWWRK